MTFQGDVGGIGLADLLQSLARGRDGILTLIGRNGLQCTLGIEAGLIHLLADPQEDLDLWRDRAKSAWAGDPESRVDWIRMTEIARAHRMETVYRLLDAESVHFRFVPGAVPKAPEDPAIGKAETGFLRNPSRHDGVWCAPVPVDGLLLEYARLKDEAVGLGAAFHLSPDTVLRTLDPVIQAEGTPRFAAECDGRSSLREIADRLGWSLRQMRIVAATAIAQGKLREAQADELLGLVQAELLEGNTGRATSRLKAWHEHSLPGPLAEQDADFFVHEWNAGRLQPALFSLPRSVARAILRRIDGSIFNPIASSERWKEYAQESPLDAISAFRCLVCQVRSGAEASLPPLRVLLATARAFNERKQPMRAAAVLRVAAERQPETTGIRLELGIGFVQAGLPDEGAPWILEASRSLIEDKQGEKVIAPLRALLELTPSNRDGRRLLSRARAGAVRSRLTGKHVLILGTALAIVGVVGFVHLGKRRDVQRRLSAIQERLSDPTAALTILEQEFPGDETAAVRQLRGQIAERRKAEAMAQRSDWTVRFRDAQTECSEGDPLLGLRRALDMPTPPDGAPDQTPLPALSDLYNVLAARAEGALRKLEEEHPDDKEQVRSEQRVLKLLSDLRSETTNRDRRIEVKRFVARLDDLRGRLETMAQERAARRITDEQQENLARQDLLLAAARAHAKAGDHARSLAVYQDLVATDPTGRIERALAREMDVERDRLMALLRARQLATEGEHQQAKSVLAAGLENFEDYLLPWKVVTVPSGARARFPDGTERVTPFTLESAFGERVAMTLAMRGCETVTIDVGEPADQTIYLMAAAESCWRSPGRVEALPLRAGEDAILCDRSGTIVRMSTSGTVRWERKVSTLAGIARTPAMLPGGSGRLLLLSEDGQAWTCEIGTGDLEGPVSLDSAPVEGPNACAESVRASLKDGRTAVWTGSLEPALYPEGDPGCAEPAVPTVAIAALRRSLNTGTSLSSPWTGWTVDVGDQACVLLGPGDGEARVSVRREGAWNYVAWEAPGARTPKGRLWISYGLGLRSYLP